MPDTSWSPWQPTDTDLELARMVYADHDRAEFAFRALAGVEALVAARENNDILTERRVVRTMRAYVQVDREAQTAKVAGPVMSDVEILDGLAAKLAEIADRFERNDQRAELAPMADVA